MENIGKDEKAWLEHCDRWRLGVGGRQEQKPAAAAAVTRARARGTDMGPRADIMWSKRWPRQVRERQRGCAKDVEKEACRRCRCLQLPTRPPPFLLILLPVPDHVFAFLLFLRLILLLLVSLLLFLFLSRPSRGAGATAATRRATAAATATSATATRPPSLCLLSDLYYSLGQQRKWRLKHESGP